MKTKKTGNQSSLQRLAGVALLAGMAISMAAESAMAQAAQPTEESLVAEARERRSVPNVEEYPTIPQAFNRAYYSNVGNFFDSQGILPSLRLIFGIPSYVESGISRDGRAVNRLYKEVLEQQIASDPVLRTPDLPNPYTGSVLTTPLVITEEPIAPAPPFPEIRRGVAEPPPGSTAPAQRDQREGPVPALW